MKRYATAFVNLLENNVKSGVILANTEIQAMTMAITREFPNDIDIVAWLSHIQNHDVEKWKSEVLQGEISIDATEIID